MSDPLLLVDDEPPALARIARVLATLGIDEARLKCAGDIAQGKALAGTKNNGITKFTAALVDLGLPDGGGIELIRWLRARDEALPILVISAWSTEEMILGALRAGANGYVLKERDDLEIAMLVKCVLKGGAPIDPFIARRILDLIGEPSPPGEGTEGKAAAAPDFVLRDSLTARELKILNFVATGMGDREIANTMDVSRWTIDSHIRHIYNKLAVNSRTQAVQRARERGLLR